MPVPTLHHLKDVVKLNFSNRPAETVEAVELKVHMDCPGCERTVRKSLSHLKGIHSVDINREQQKVTVTGFVDKGKVLNRVRRKGKFAEEWSSLDPSPEQTVEAKVDEMDVPSTYVYRYDPTVQYGYGYVIPSRGIVYESPSRGYSARPHGPIVETFSEDNPNNCSVM